MKIVVMKFGGSSVADVSKIQNVAKIVAENSKKNKILVVLSAMFGVTNKLQTYIDEVNYHPSPETDMIMTSGEQVSVGLLSMILNKQKVKTTGVTQTITKGDGRVVRTLNTLDLDSSGNIQFEDDLDSAGNQQQVYPLKRWEFI